MKKIIFTLLFMITTSVPLYGESVTLSTYIPAPYGSFDQMRLVPRALVTCDASVEGLIINDNSGAQNAVKICSNGTFVNFAGSWSQSGSDFYLTDLNANVGIGTTTPQALLHLQSDDANYTSLRLDNTESLAGIWELRSVQNSTYGPNNGFAIWGGHNNGTEDTRLTIEPDNGNVGIGVLEATAKLEVLGNLVVANDASFDDTGDLNIIGYSPLTPAAIGLTGIDNSDDLFVGDDLGIGKRVEVGQSIRVHNTNNGDNWFMNDVGIGTTTPSARLEVTGGAIKATGGLIIETRTSDPVSPADGQMWLRTDI